MAIYNDSTEDHSRQGIIRREMQKSKQFNQVAQVGNEERKPKFISSFNITAER
jgi:hypothetical protein